MFKERLKDLFTIMKGLWLATIIYAVCYYVGTWVGPLIDAPADHWGQRYLGYPVLGAFGTFIFVAIVVVFYMLGDALPKRKKEES